VDYCSLAGHSSATPDLNCPLVKGLLTDERKQKKLQRF
jgi:hypothetical protein